jgi:hypothetical protein
MLGAVMLLAADMDPDQPLKDDDPIVVLNDASSLLDRTGCGAPTSPSTPPGAGRSTALQSSACSPDKS